MPKNILVITGSPRAGGNSDILAEAFIRGALGTGASVQRFDAGRAKIGGCIACDTCWSKGIPCSFEDDFQKLVPLLEAADTLVLASPLYWFTFPAQLKAALDKTYAYSGSRAKVALNIRESFLLMCAHDTEPLAFEGAEGTYRQIVHYMGWQDRGMLLAPGVGTKGEITATDYPARAEALGKTV